MKKRSTLKALTILAFAGGALNAHAIAQQPKSLSLSQVDARVELEQLLQDAYDKDLKQDFKAKLDESLKQDMQELQTELDEEIKQDLQETLKAELDESLKLEAPLADREPAESPVDETVEAAEEAIEDEAIEVAEETIEDEAVEVAEETIEDEAVEVAEEAIEDEAVEVAEEAIEDEAIEVAEEAIEDEIVEAGEASEVVADFQLEELEQLKSEKQGLETMLCKQENQIDELRKQIAQLQQESAPYMPLMQSMNQLMMMNMMMAQQQMTISYQPTAIDLMSQMLAPTMLMQSMNLGMRMASMNDMYHQYRAPAPSGPQYHYNIGGDFYGRDYSMTATYPQQQAPQQIVQAQTLPAPLMAQELATAEPFSYNFKERFEPQPQQAPELVKVEEAVREPSNALEEDNPLHQNLEGLVK